MINVTTIHSNFKDGGSNKSELFGSIEIYEKVYFN